MQLEIEFLKTCYKFIIK